VWRVTTDGSSPPQPVTKGDGIETTPVAAVTHDLRAGRDRAQPLLPARVRGPPPTVARESSRRMFPERGWWCRRVTFRAADGLTIHGQISRHRRASPDSGVVFVTVAHSSDAARRALHGILPHAYAENQFLANHGIVVLSVNYRLGSM